MNYFMKMVQEPWDCYEVAFKRTVMATLINDCLKLLNIRTAIPKLCYCFLHSSVSTVLLQYSITYLPQAHFLFGPSELISTSADSNDLYKYIQRWKQLELKKTNLDDNIA